MEFGTPWDLLQNEGGVFRDLCRQSGEESQLFEVSQSCRLLCLSCLSYCKSPGNSCTLCNASALYAPHAKASNPLPRWSGCLIAPHFRGKRNTGDHRGGGIDK